MFKVGDIIRIELFDGELTEDSFEIDQITENDFYKYRLISLKNNLPYIHSGKGFVIDKKYYRKEKISKLIDIL
jgi:hypothetical protein